MKIELDNPFDSASIEGTSLLKLDFSKLQLKSGDVIPVNASTIKHFKAIAATKFYHLIMNFIQLKILANIHIKRL